MLTSLVEYVVKKIVDQPDAIVVAEEAGDESIALSLKVAPEDVGKVIGKAGKTARALRFLVQAAASKSGKRATITIEK